VYISAFDPAWKDRMASALQRYATTMEPLTNSVFKDQIASALQRYATTMEPLTNPVFKDQIASALQQLHSAASREAIFRALQHLDTIETDAEFTWWVELPLQVRATVIGAVVWAYLFLLLSTLSLEHQADAAVLRENTGLNPVVLAGAVACFVGTVYRHFARPDGP
jgi:hypothetical protein